MKTKDKGEAEEINEILRDKKVQKALKESGNVSTEETPAEKAESSTAVWITAVVFAVCVALYFLLEYEVLPVSSGYIPLAQKLVLGSMLVAFVLILNYFLRKVFRRRIEGGAQLYNIRSLINFITFFIILIIIVSLLFANWYATMVSFGVISLILGLALQNPISSLFGWMYLLIRKPYEVGDRIKIGPAYGDVMRVGYLDTTLWEFRGDYLSGDHPSGRTIRFANSKVFSEYVYNYSWPLFPFMWNEVKFYVSYDSDLTFIQKRVTEIAEQEVGSAMVRRVKRLKKILANTLVQELEIKERPSVIFSAQTNAWIEVTVRFLVQPKNAGSVKSLLFRHIMEDLIQHPDKVVFPNSSNLERK